MVIPELFAHISILWAGSGLPRGAATTFGVANVTDQTAAQVASDVADAWTASTLMGNLSSLIQTTTVRVKLGPNNDGPFTDGTMSIFGGAATTVASPQVAYLCKKTTGFGGRRSRGRFFLPGVLEANVDAAGVVTSGVVSAINTDLAALLAELSSRDVPMVLLHDDPGVPYAVTSLVCDGRVATQRRRLRG